MQILKTTTNAIQNFFYTHQASCEIQEACPKGFFQKILRQDPGMCTVTKFTTDCPKQFMYSRAIVAGAAGIAAAPFVVGIGMLGFSIISVRVLSSFMAMQKMQQR